MLGVGISYIIIGLVPFFVKKVNGQLEAEVAKIYKYFLYCGISIIFLYYMGYFFYNGYQSFIAVFPVLFFAMLFLRYIRRTFNV
ncbi:hypothetical protein ABD87_15110 [Lysinibacillus sphaericus]|uniref:hypothetical protein n=1 Tax=Lysinibacillus sphaericus TaxID=1421 RepID=UPI0018CD0DE2|nr:hypothetical protein [Lysinibacillus sphaericus]MBG9730818.1 hypothetical protein [Lysinibacillus sphaericus]